MFKLLRSRAKFFYWIIAISFILFTFIVWGAQCNSQDARQQQGPTWIGSINGDKISTAEWDETYRNYLAQMRNQYQTNSLTVNQRALAAETVWQYLLRSKLEEREIERRHLAVTNDEIVDILKNSPPPELLASFTTPEGEVDMDAYFAELANPERDWTGVEAYLRSMVPRQKLAEEIAAGAMVTDQEVRDAFYGQNMKAVAEYVGVLYNDLTVEHQPTETEIAEYYAAHEEDFFEPEMVSVQLVKFIKQPSNLDELDVKELALEIRQELVDGTLEFAEAAAIYSEDGTKDDGGDLGIFDRERMVDEFTEVAFTLPVGEVSAPVKTQFGFHLIEVLEQFEEEGEIARVHARHILFNVTPGDETITALYDQANRFREDAQDVGFAEAAADAALEVLHPRPVHESRDIPGYRNTIRGALFAFSSETGAIGPVMENEDYFYVVHNVDYLPEGPAPLDDVEAQVVVQVNRDKKAAMADDKLNPAVGALQMGRDFVSVADEFGLAHAVTDTFTATGNISGVGYNTDFNKAALENDAGVLVEKVDTNRGLFAMKVLWKSAFDDVAFTGIQAGLYEQLLIEKKGALVDEWYEQQMDAAKIEDRRSMLSGN